MDETPFAVTRGVVNAFHDATMCVSGAVWEEYKWDSLDEGCVLLL